MKQTLLSFKALFLVLMVSLFASNAWADTYTVTPDKTTTGSTATSYVTSLTSFTSNGISWSINQWNPSNLQIKTNQSSAASEFRFYNTSAFPGKITKVVITFSALTLKSTETTGMMFVGGSSEVTTTTGGADGVWDNTAKTLTWEPSASDNFTYFAFFQNGKVATGTNKLATTDAIVVTYEASGDTRTATTTSFPASTYSTYMGEAFAAPTATVKAGETTLSASVTYSSSAESVATVDASGAVTLVGPGTTTIKASYAGDETTYKPSSASYTLTVGKVYASLADLVADGEPVANPGIPVKVTLTDEVIQSIVTSGTYRNGIMLKSGDQEVEVYCKNVPDSWEAYGKVSGTVTGSWMLYSTSTWEVSHSDWSQLTYTAPAKSAQTVTLGTYKAAMTTTDAADSFSAETNGDGALSVESSNPEVATATISEGTVTVTPVAAGTTTITVTAAATDTWNAGSKSYTLTVTEPVLPAALPFSFDGNGTAASTTQGVTNNGVGNYSSAPKLKFDTTGDNLIINYNADGGKLSYTIKGMSFSGGTFDVMESADGTEYTSVKSYTEFGSSATTETATLNAASRYVKFVYTTKSSGNVALGAISIKAAGALEDPELAFEKATYTFAANAEDKAVNATSAAGSTGAVTYALTEGDATAFLIDESTGDIVCETAGTYTVTATIAATEEYESKTATATVTIEEATATPVVLVAKYGDKYYAMDCDFDAVQVRVDNGKVYVPSAEKENLTWNMTTVGTETTFAAFDGEYLAAKTGSGLQLQDASYAWTLNSETNTWSTKVGSSTRSFFYQAASNAFKNYATSNAGKEGYSELTLAYTDIEGVEDVTANLSIQESLGCATFCAPFDLDLTNYAEVYNVKAYTADEVVDNSWIKLTEVTGTVPAATPVVLYGDAIDDTPHGFAVTTATTCTKGCLTGNIGTEKTPLEIGSYILQCNNNETGWYKVAATGLNCGVNRCYIPTGKIVVSNPGARQFFPMSTDEATGINGISAAAATKADGKYLVKGQIVVVKAGKAYNMGGQIVK